MREDLEAVDRLRAKTVLQVLADLASARGEFRSGKQNLIPLISLSMRNGPTLRGYVIDLREEKGRQSLLLHLPGENLLSPAGDIAYLDASEVAAVVVHDAGPMALALEAGKPPPSRLEISRKAAEAEKALTEALGTPIKIEIDWEKTEEKGRALARLALLIDRTGQVLREIAADELGRTALTRLRRVRLLLGAKPGAELGGSVLTLTASEADDGPITSAELKTAIESAL